MLFGIAIDYILVVKTWTFYPMVAVSFFLLMLMEYRYDIMKLHQFAPTPQIGGEEATEAYVKEVKARRCGKSE